MIIAPAAPFNPPREVVSAPPPPEPILAAEEVTLAYGRSVILRDVNLQIHAGEFWCFLGPNGEGKSTLIKALLGAVRPRRGRILLRADFLKRTRIGFVPQESELNAAVPTTTEEFILTGLVGVPASPATRVARLKRVMELVGLTRQRTQSLWTLSGGQRQRAMVARALIRDPLLLIVDEPTAGLDLAAAAGLLETLTSLGREHQITVVFVTHDLQIAAQRASHAALFRNGTVTAGPLAEVFTPDGLARTFGIPVEVRRNAAGVMEVFPTGGSR
jgi:ABC-type Mn2+/Zn2+ transport system ATPase subunit